MSDAARHGPPLAAPPEDWAAPAPPPPNRAARRHNSREVGDPLRPEINFLTALRKGGRGRRLPPLSTLFLLLLGLFWIGALVQGAGETIVLIAPLEIRGNLGPGGADRYSAALRMVDHMTGLQRELAAPGLEYRIGGGSLDRSLDPEVEIRLLPSATGERVRYLPAVSSKGWSEAIPGSGAFVAEARRIGWLLTGRRVRVVHGIIYAAAGRLTLETELDGRLLENTVIPGDDWTRGLYPVGDSLLLKVQPTLAAANYMRINHYEAAQAAVQELLENRNPADDGIGLAFQELIRQELDGTWIAPQAGFAAAIAAGPAWTRSRWQMGLRRGSPAAAQWREGQVLAQTFAAYRALKGGWKSAAEERLETVFDTAPQDPQVRLLLGYVYYVTGNYQRGYVLLDEGCRLLPPEQTSHLYLLFGMTCEKLHSKNQANEAYALAFRGRPNDAILLNNRGVSAYFAYDKPAAMEFFNQAAQQRPVRVVVLQNRGLLYNERDQDGDAVSNLQWGLRITPNQPSVYLQLARIAFDAGQYDQAASLLFDGTRAIPEHAELAMQYGYVLAAAGRYDEALAYLGSLDAVKLPTDRLALYRGHVWFLKGDLQQAGDYYQLSMDNNEPSGSAIYARAQVAFLEQRWIPAFRGFEYYSGRYPDNTRARLFRFLTESKLSLSGAQAKLSPEVRDEHRDWLRRLLEMYLTDELRPPAGVEAMSSAELARRACTEQYHLGEWHAAHGRNVEAIAAFEKSLATGLAHHYEYQAARHRLAALQYGLTGA